MPAACWRTRALGVEVAVELPALGSSDTFLAQLDSRWELARDQPLHPEALQARCLVAATEPLAGHDRVSAAVTMAALRAHAGRLWMVHAACLADPATGRAILLVGPSGAGKSTAARVLGTRLGYASDEAAGVAPDGRVWAHPKPLSIVTTASPWKRQVGPAEASLLPAPACLRLAAIALLDRRPGDGPRLRRMGTAEAMVRLAEQSSYLTRLDRPLGVIAGHLARVGGAVEISYSDATSLLDTVADLLVAP